MAELFTLTADEIVSRLAERHTNDVFVPECKDGPSQSDDHLRLDAWAMNRSWKHATATGYEVKISRSDWLRGLEKLPAYMQLCNQLYVVAPKGVVQDGELPDGVGLMMVSDSGRLTRRKVARHRAVTIPENFYRYILMCRASIDVQTEPSDSWTREQWEGWIRRRQLDKVVGSKVRFEASRSFRRMAGRLRRLEHLRKSTMHLQKRLRELGLDPEEPIGKWGVDHKLNDLLRCEEHNKYIRQVMNLRDATERMLRRNEEVANA